MIIVNGQTLEDSFKNEYPERSVERDIINILFSSEKKYKYESLDGLKFEIRLRKEIIDASKELNRSNFSFEVFRKSKCNEEYWERTEEGGFKLKEDVLPSEAIEDIFKNGHKYATECATAMVIVYYKALLNIFPKELFNKLFTDIILMNWHYIHPLLREVGFVYNVEDYLPGDRRYFKNPDVDPETPYLQGQNVIYLGDGLYYGHGTAIKTADAIIALLNRHRAEDADEKAYLIDSAGRPNFKKISDLYHELIDDYA